MRVFHCISSLSGGGAEQQLSYLAPCMADKNIEVHIAYLTPGPKHPDFNCNNNNIKLHQIKYKNNYDPLIIWRLVVFFKNIQPDLIHIWIPQMCILGGIAAILCRIPWIIREANSANAHIGWKGRLREVIAHRASYIIANSVTGCDYWRNILPQKPCALIYNGLPESLFSQLDSLKKRSVENHRQILFIGRLVPQKNIFLLLRAAVKLSIKLEFKILICGIGGQFNQVREFIKQYNLGEHVILCGHVKHEKILTLLRESTILVTPSYFEGCPNVVLEAMANKCPVAVSSILAHTDILDHKSAFFFAPDDQNTLEALLEVVLCDGNEAQKKALEARRVAESFKLERMVDAYIEIYSKVLSSVI